MSRSFLGIPSFSYRGSYITKDTKLCAPALQPPRIVALDIDWSQYGNAGTANPNVGIFVSLPQNISDQLGSIKSVYIDNTNSNISLYVSFPDTGFTITAPPATATWYPVFTNQWNLQIFGIGFLDGNIPTARIFISNREMAPSVDSEIFQAINLWKGSPSIQRLNLLQPGYGAPALGDQFSAVRLGANQATVLPADLIMIAAQAGGFTYINAFNLFSSLMDAQFAAPGNNTQKVRIALRDFTTGIDIYITDIYCAVENASLSFAVSVNDQIISVSGINFRLDGTHNYGFRIDQSQGGASAWTFQASAWIAYTQNPQ